MLHPHQRACNNSNQKIICRPPIVCEKGVGVVRRNDQSEVARDVLPALHTPGFCMAANAVAKNTEQKEKHASLCDGGKANLGRTNSATSAARIKCWGPC